jgi:hypothetical protein
MNVEMGRDYTTRDGRAVRVYAVDGGGSYPVHGAILSPTRNWVANCWREDGRWLSGDGADGDSDLVEAPRKFRLERWVNIYPTHGIEDGGRLHWSREDADHACVFDARVRIACVRIVIEGAEGDGLVESKEG